MTWLFLTIAALTCRGVYGVLSKVMGRNLPTTPPITAVVMLTGAGLLAIPVSPFVGGLSFSGVSDHWGMVLLVVVAGAVGNAAYFQGLHTLEAGVAQIVFASIIVWGLGLSVTLLHSHFNWVQLLGAVVLISAIALAQYDGRFRLHQGAWFILLAAFLFAIFQVCVARFSKDISTGAYLLITNLGPALLIALAYGKRTVRELASLRAVTREAILASFATVTASLGYFVCAYFAYRDAPDAGVVVILLTAQVVVAVLLSALFLKERKNLGRKLSSGVLAFVAGALIHR